MEVSEVEEGVVREDEETWLHVGCVECEEGKGRRTVRGKVRKRLKVWQADRKDRLV